MKAVALLQATDPKAAAVESRRCRDELRKAASGSESRGSLEGPEDLKERLRVILETLTGHAVLAEACERLGVSAVALA
jgi:hypothetical protein